MRITMDISPDFYISVLYVSDSVSLMSDSVLCREDMFMYFMSEKTIYNNRIFNKQAFLQYVYLIFMSL